MKLYIRISKKLLLLVMVVFFGFASYSQGKITKKRTLNEKVFIGGGLGITLGNFTGIEIAPMAGYRPIENAMTGVKLTYQYMSSVDNEASINIYGGSMFAEYIMFENFIAHAELETLNIDINGGGKYLSENYWYTAPLIGGGYYQKMGYRSALIIMALFDVSGSSKSLYANPIIRMAIMF